MRQVVTIVLSNILALLLMLLFVSEGHCNEASADVRSFQNRTIFSGQTPLP